MAMGKVSLSRRVSSRTSRQGVAFDLKTFRIFGSSSSRWRSGATRPRMSWTYSSKKRRRGLSR